MITRENKILKYSCDKCGTELSTSTEARLVYTPSNVNNLTHSWDICQTCLMELTTMLGKGRIYPKERR